MLGIVEFASGLFRQSAEERRDRLAAALCHREFELETGSSKMAFGNGPYGPFAFAPTEVAGISKDPAEGQRVSRRYAMWRNRFGGRDPKEVMTALGVA